MFEAGMEKKLLIDSKRNVWVFFSTPSNKTAYIVKGFQGDTQVVQLDELGFVKEMDLIMDRNDNIHAIALDSDQRVVYLKYNFNRWITHTLYSFPGKTIGISNLKIVKEKSNLHLLYVYSEKGGGCALFHHHWSGNRWKGYKVFDVPGGEGEMCYDAEAAVEGGLRVVAAARKSLVLWEFDGSQWAQKGKNERDEWENIGYITLQQGGILYKNYRGVYYQDDIHKMERARPKDIIASEHVEREPVVINRKNTLYVTWIEGDNMGYRASYDRGSSWGRVKYYHNVRGQKLEIYSFADNYSLLVKAKRVIATRLPELHIPFLHRSTESIKLPREAFVKVQKDDTNSGVPADISNNLPRQQNNNGSDGESEINKHNETITKLQERIATRMDRMEAALQRLEQRLELEVLEGIRKLDSEVSQLKKDIENSGRDKEKPEHPTGSLINQDLINAYLRKR